MEAIGAEYDPDSAGLFVFGRVSPSLATATQTPGEVLSDRFLYGAGVFITPGFIFGRNGVNYVRISLCAPVPVLEKALQKVKALIESGK